MANAKRDKEEALQRLRKQAAQFAEHPQSTDELQVQSNYEVNMSEPSREGDEMSGDEHSSGLQGGEPELEEQPSVDSGTPGKETSIEEFEVDEREKKRAS